MSANIYIFSLKPYIYVPACPDCSAVSDMPDNNTCYKENPVGKDFWPGHANQSNGSKNFVIIKAMLQDTYILCII